MSGYVPPHLRKGGGSAAAPPSPAASRERPAQSDRTTDSSYRKFAGSRSGSSNSLERDGKDYGTSKRSPEATSPAQATWQPSSRVLALTTAQVAELRKRLNVVVEEDAAGKPVTVAPVESFDDMNLHANIMLDIRQREYQSPTPIQAQGIPLVLSGRDVLGCAETGSGKTASFAIPMIQQCINAPALRRGDGPVGLVLAPTRELAQQVAVFSGPPNGSNIEKEMGAFSRSSRGVSTCIVVGGVSMSEQRGALRGGVEIVVATPGRLIDHLQQRNTALNRVSLIVLDEADRMLDMGFEPSIAEIMAGLPSRHQTLLFSATMPVEIEELANKYFSDPVRLKVGQVSTPTANVAQALQKTTEANKIDDVVLLLYEEMQQADTNGHRMPLTIVFVERKLRADQVAEALRAETISAAALHGGLSQPERQSALAEFTAGRISVLVATDVASRGLDIKGIGHVVNADLPKTFEDYVHRIGRTGRAGATGRATSFYTDRDSFLVAQIKRALQEQESGNATAFQTGKAARAKEKEAALEFKEKLALGSSNLVGTEGAAAVKVAEKYSHMATAQAASIGAADDAWDD